MRTRSMARGMFALLLCAVQSGLGLPAAQAEIPTHEKVLVTDTFLLRQMGFEPGEEVYLWTNGSYDSELASYLSDRGFEPQRHDRGGPVNPAVGSTDHFFAVNGRQFQERDSVFERRSPDGLGELACALGSADPFADAQLQIPTGSRLRFVRVWGSDHCFQDISVFVNEYCQPDFAPGSVSTTVVASGSSSDPQGEFSFLILIPGDVRIDNLSCTYQVRARFGSSPDANICGLTLRLYKARAQFVTPSEGEVVVAVDPSVLD